MNKYEAMSKVLAKLDIDPPLRLDCHDNEISRLYQDFLRLQRLNQQSKEWYEGRIADLEDEIAELRANRASDIEGALLDAREARDEHEELTSYFNSRR